MGILVFGLIGTSGVLVLLKGVINFLRTDTLEASDIHNKIREMYAQLNRPRPAQGGPGTNPLMGPAGTGPRGAAGGPRGGR